MKALLLLIFTLLCHKLLLCQSYTSYFTGDTADFVSEPLRGVVLAGGAGDHDNAMKWMLERANGGDVVVIRASGSDGYNEYFYSELNVEVNSVESIVFNNVNASDDPYVIGRINQAECIFIAGGDQWNYVNFWRDSPIEEALNNFINIKGGVIGGTSAGMAILGGHYFSAENGSVTSNEALNDPYNEYMTIGHQDFIHIPLLDHVITDTHYDDPDRRGRHATFIARILQDGYDQSFGIACMEWVAVAIDENGIAHCFGEYPDYDEHVYFIRPNCDEPSGPEVCEADQPLTWDRNQAALKVFVANARLDGSSTFNLNSWETISDDGEWQNWWVSEGDITYVENQLPPECLIENISTISKEEFFIGPIPADEILHIRTAEEMDLIEIRDAYGKLVLSDKNEDIDASSLNDGVYFLFVKNKNETLYIRRIVVQ